MPKKYQSYRKYLQKHAAAKRTDADGIYKNKADRHFLGRFLRRNSLHPVAVVGESRKKVLVVSVTHHPKSAASKGYSNPNKKDKRKVYLDRGVQKSGTGSVYVVEAYKTYRHEPIDDGLDAEIDKWRKKKK